jgi:hypothetical protein
MKIWCERCDSNARTPTRLDSESSAFDLAGQLSHDMTYVAAAIVVFFVLIVYP